MINWVKKGLVFCPEAQFPSMHTHAANPFAVPTADPDIFRVYFTCRDQQSRSAISYCEMNAADNFKVIYVHDQPVLEPGEPGLFDDSGVATGFIINYGGQILLYYLGWNLKVTVPWLNTIGLAIWSDAEGKFIKQSRVPVMDRSEEDPFTISYPSIMEENGVLRMWYGSNLRWGKTQETMQHIFKYAESEDGRDWKRFSRTVVDLTHPGEYALSKPFVIKKSDIYHMWYSYRGNGDIQTYRIGYARSQDGVNWERLDKIAGIDVSPSGWDSEMICYPDIFEYRGKLVMLYNGNGYGRTGFGVATEE